MIIFEEKNNTAYFRNNETRLKKVSFIAYKIKTKKNGNKTTKRMKGITKCEGINCPFKETCYRFTAQDKETHQYYSPFWKSAKHNEDGEFECDSYVNNATII